MKRLALALLFVLCAAALVRAETLTVASGAGYKRLVTDLATAYEAKSGKKLELIFGNMGQVIAQAKASGKVSMIIGEQSFLKKSGVPLASFTELGKGALVVAWPKGKSMSGLGDLAKPEVKRVAMPDAAKAIYGVAGMEALERAGLSDAIKGKLLVVATVPQVMTYVVSGEVDAGLANLTDVQGQSDKIGGYFVVDRSQYSPISIGAGVLAGQESAEVAAFVAFLNSAKGRELARKHGL
ncbi:molybdate transport system substrate-binding protein [Humidesulfovibrio mexicanus]|uniref:Molybdate transport system substrate-binding protein n=1 Tax=Humidesulfovibrio mexicanus TaxID=147047 RepID=A0A239A312_9BACT|nr:molybdate ABC transporter substrate-binding protein [Humidesulfovibrio mexicanus]SNR89293.1 molybdate transport system substrate-binding protein [Humidesulfovibrio mexicanus]